MQLSVLLRSVKRHSRTGHEVTQREKRYSSTLSLTSALDTSGWSTPHPGCFTPGKDTVHTVLEDGWATGPVWTGAENLVITGIRFQDTYIYSSNVFVSFKMIINENEICLVILLEVECDI